MGNQKHLFGISMTVAGIMLPMAWLMGRTVLVAVGLSLCVVVMGLPVIAGRKSGML